MMLATGQDAQLTLSGDGRVVGPALAVNSANVVHGNALQAPGGTIVIASSDTQSVATAGFISAANTVVSGYELCGPVATLGVATALASVPTLQAPSGTAVIDGAGAPIPAELMAAAIDIEGGIVTSNLGLYAKTSISEAGLAFISTGTLTGSAGVLQNGQLPAGLTHLGWTNPTTFGWLTPGVDTVGNVQLIPPVRYNDVATLADFRATGNFRMSDAPQQNVHTVTQVGTLQAGTAVQATSTPYELALTVSGQLIVEA
ncbi:MAG: hypothetical protein ACJ8AI_14340 [Rhodopila sp.]